MKEITENEKVIVDFLKAYEPNSGLTMEAHFGGEKNSYSFAQRSERHNAAVAEVIKQIPKTILENPTTRTTVAKYISEMLFDPYLKSVSGPSGDKMALSYTAGNSGLETSKTMELSYGRMSIDAKRSEHGKGKVNNSAYHQSFSIQDKNLCSEHMLAGSSVSYGSSAPYADETRLRHITRQHECTQEYPNGIDQKQTVYGRTLAGAVSMTELGKLMTDFTVDHANQITESERHGQTIIQREKTQDAHNPSSEQISISPIKTNAFLGSVSPIMADMGTISYLPVKQEDYQQFTGRQITAEQLLKLAQIEQEKKSGKANS